jgi:hypothetical protein
MARSILSRLFSRGREDGARRRVVRRPVGVTLTLEVLEDRLTPSGGPGGGPGPSGGHGGGGPGPSSSTAAVLQPGGQAPTFNLASLLATLSDTGVLLNDLTSGPGYPLAPSGGPSLQGNMRVVADPSTFPLSMQTSDVAVVPVLLTADPGTGSGSAPSSYTLVLLDPMTGMTYSLSVTLIPPAPGSGGP